MAIKIDLIAPQPPAMPANHAAGHVVPSSAMTLQRWLKAVGDKIIAGEPIVELIGNNAIFYVHAPANGTLSSVNVIGGQNILSGHLLGQVAVVSKDEIDWNNLDQVTELLSDFLEKSKTFKEIKDTTEALGQLLGVEENQVFFNMSTEEQNQFLQSVIDQHQSNQLAPSEIARKMLVDLELRPPQFAPQAPAGPVFGFGMRGPTPSGPGGMGGGLGGGGYNPAAHQQPHHGGQYGYHPNNTMPPSAYDYPQQHQAQHQGQHQGQPFGGGAIPQPNAYPSYPVTPAQPHQAPYMPEQHQTTGLVPPASDYYEIPADAASQNSAPQNQETDHNKPLPPPEAPTDE